MYNSTSCKQLSLDDSQKLRTGLINIFAFHIKKTVIFAPFELSRSDHHHLINTYLSEHAPEWFQHEQKSIVSAASPDFLTLAELTHDNFRARAHACSLGDRFLFRLS
jgi:hypothetical protein